MKKIIVSILMLISFKAFSQANDTMAISLSQAIDLGLKNRFDVKANEYNAVLAANNINKSKKEWIPEISASGNLHYNTQLQATYIPAGFVGLTQPELLAFGAKNATIAGLDLNQVIYKPGINSNIKIAKNDLELEKEKNHADQVTVKTQITVSYFDMQLKQLQFNIATNDEARYKEYFTLAEGKYNNGALIESDYLHAKLDYENAKVQTEVANQNYALAMDNLKYQINLPNNVRLILSDSLSSNNADYQFQANVSADNRTEIKQLLLQQKDNELQLNKVRQNALPTVSLFANYSQQYLYDNFDYMQSKWWTPFSYVGVKVSIPITSNIKNHNTIKEYQLKAQQTDLRLKQETTDINYEIQKTMTELKNASHNMQVTHDNYTLSNVIYQNKEKQYSLGAFQYDDLLDTEKSLNTAEQNYIKAVYDFLIARFNYEKAIGNL